ncbi:MAG TPA: methyltransferase domain-containing protein [Planctomycetaceae bacterium]|nr:methyltransferase domain-containing protein [Planctomycetaceae bacterium]
MSALRKLWDELIGVRRAWAYAALVRTVERGVRGHVGLEIGGPSPLFAHDGGIPVYPFARRLDNCNFSRLTVWEGPVTEGNTFHFHEERGSGWQFVCEATDLHEIANQTYDFVVSSHTLEHIANPLRALEEWLRVLKDGGLLVIVVPHRDGTFDHRREITPLDHMVEDYDRSTREDDLTHLDEILKLHDLERDPPAGEFEAFGERSRENLHYRCLHHHVFSTRSLIMLLNYAGIQLLHVEALLPYHIIAVARKGGFGRRTDNSRFLRPRSGLLRRSPFPTDHL